MASVTLDALRKQFPDGTLALDDLSLQIEDREFVTLLGPSGCGKTTTLRMIAGLDTPSNGRILFGSRRVDQLTPAARNVAMVFQSYALYPHMTVRRNLEYPLRKRGVAATERQQRVARTAALLKIEALLDRLPRQLSGGQQQRVALGRAMVRDCDVFLLDEPLSNLDAELRAHMRAELVQLHRRFGHTMIYVTHDQAEAMTMSTRMVVLRGGQLQQVGTPDEVYHAPTNRFVAGFVGSPTMNFVPGILTEAVGVLRFEAPSLVVALPDARRVELARAPARSVLAGIRPEDLRLEPGDGPGRILIVERLGHESIVWVGLGEQRLCCRAPPDAPLMPDQPVRFIADPTRVHLFDADGARRLNGRC
jgi:multiple sugar transport system ATP-binding protein